MSSGQATTPLVNRAFFDDADGRIAVP